MKIFTDEKRQAWNDVLFWARRLSYKTAANRPEWREKYEEAKRRLSEITKAEEEARRTKS